MCPELLRNPNFLGILQKLLLLFVMILPAFFPPDIRCGQTLGFHFTSFSEDIQCMGQNFNHLWSGMWQHLTMPSS